MKFLVFVTISFGSLLHCQMLEAQQSFTNNDESHLSISAIGETMAVADIAYMSINISINDEDADRAFELHRERESFLAGLLMDLDFEDDKINYQPITIRPNRQRDGEIHSITTQQIRLELDDIDMLGELQKILIQNGFDNFSGNLSSTKLEEAGNEALRQAVSNARKDAEILAQAANKTLGRVISIDHTSDRSFRPAALAETFDVRAMSDSGPSMFEFSQTVPVQKNVSIRFELLNE